MEDYSSPYRAGREAAARAAAWMAEKQRKLAKRSDSERCQADAESSSMASRIRHRQFLASIRKPYVGSSIRQPNPDTSGAITLKRRTNHCYSCRSRVDSAIHALCPSCTLLNIICPTCGACGCGYNNPAIQQYDRDEEWVGDSVENWFVFEDGKCVYPPNIDYPLLDRTVRIAGYEAYLQSTTWREKRNGALRSASHECEECGAKERLHVHHRNYDRVGGNELPSDLQVLCETCHYAVHSFATAYLAYLIKDDLGN